MININSNELMYSRPEQTVVVFFIISQVIKPRKIGSINQIIPIKMFAHRTGLASCIFIWGNCIELLSNRNNSSGDVHLNYSIIPVTLWMYKYQLSPV